jgi:hypothetical protein
MGSSNFSSTLDSLKGYHVNLYVGEEIIKGKLMEIEKDHLVLEDENNYIFYYSIDKIQAITKNTKQFKAADITSEYVKTQTLVELLHSLKNTWVTILCLNKQSFAGVLSIVDTDFVTLINGEERILVKFTHISKILKGYIKEEKSEDKSSEGNSNDQKTEEKVVEAAVSESQYKKVEINPQREKVKKVEKEISKVVINEKEKETKIWTEPAKNTAEKAVQPKTSIEMKKPEVKVSSHNEVPKQEVKQEKQPEIKVQKQEVAAEKETVQKPTILFKETKVPVKEVQNEVKPLLMNAAMQRDKQTQELLAKVKKVKETYEKTQPLKKMEPPKKPTAAAKNNEEVPVAQEVGASRFSGEPAPRVFDRRSIFSGWPSRQSESRRF